MTEPSLEGLLTEQQIVDLGRIVLGIYRIQDVIQRINLLAQETGLPLRLIPEYHAALLGNDISQLMFSHDLAEKRIAAAAFAAVEGLAA